MKAGLSLLGAAFLLPSVLLGADKAKEALAVPEADEIEIKAEGGEYDLKDDVIHLKPGKNSITYGSANLEAREMWFNQKTADFKAEGDVVLSMDEDARWAAPQLQGNFETKTIEFENYGFDGNVWHSAGKGGKVLENGDMKLHDAWISTCDCYPPHYCISASDIQHHPDHTFTAKNVKLKLGGVPVFYLPYAWGTTDDTAGWIFHPGYSGKRGVYLRVGRIWRLDEQDSFTRTYLDLMSKRGVALGHDTEIHSGNHELAVTLYGLRDEDSPDTEHGWNRRFDVEDWRYRANVYYSYKVGDTSALRLNVDYMSDIDMLEDWFKHDYRQIRQPKSYLNWTTDGSFYNFSVNVRPRINEFYTVAETLPEVRFDIPRLNIASTPIDYQSSSSFGYYSMKWRNFDRHRWDILKDDYDPDDHQDPRDYSTFRANTSQFLYLPTSIADIVTFTPRAGFMATYYSRSSKRRMSGNDIARLIEVDNPDHVYNHTRIRQYDSAGGDVSRIAFEIGAEAKSRLYSDWSDINLGYIDAKGLRHVIEPYVNYTYAPDPSHDRDHLYYFDEIDRLEKQHFVRFGADQLWQTRRGDRIETIARLQNYVDVHMFRGDESESHTGDFGTRGDIYPASWLNLWATLLHDIGEGQIQRGEVGFRYGEEEDFNLSARYVYRNDHISRSAYSMGSTLVDLTGESSYYKKYFETADTLQLDAFIPLNSLTSLEVSAEYDFDRSRLASHKYILNRLLHCWIMSLGVGWDDGDFEAMIMFRLKAFPGIKIDLDI